jgi:hypothetical protein
MARGAADPRTPSTGNAEVERPHFPACVPMIAAIMASSGDARRIRTAGAPGADGGPAVSACLLPERSPLVVTGQGAEIMSKSKDVKKEPKKAPAKSIKEKREAKRAKREGQG